MENQNLEFKKFIEEKLQEMFSTHEKGIGEKYVKTKVEINERMENIEKVIFKIFDQNISLTLFYFLSIRQYKLIRMRKQKNFIKGKT